MRRLRPVAVLAAILALAAVWVAPSSGGDPVHPFAGEWVITFSFGGTGTFTFDFVDDDAAGFAEMNTIAMHNGSHAVACEEPSDYYEGTWSSPTDSGTLAGCTHGDDRNIYAPYTNSGGVGFGVFLVATLAPDGKTFSGHLYSDPDGDDLFQANSSIDGTRHCPQSGRGLAGGACPVEEPPTGPVVGPSPPEDLSKCEGKEATITPNPDAPPGFAISGTAADDVIVGTDGDDRILGLGGNDIICGFSGNDELIGAEGNDNMYGGLGNDMLDGGSGVDRLVGDKDVVAGIDKAVSSGGNDTLLAGDGNDYLEGGPGNDSLSAGPGNDELWGGLFQGVGGFKEKDLGGSDNDQLLGEDGQDAVSGGRGNDKLDGGADDDSLDDGSGNDELIGGAGADRFWGGPGNDTIDGGEQDDQRPGRFTGQLFGDFVNYGFAPRAENIDLSKRRATGGFGRDVLGGIESIYGSKYNDVIRGSNAADLLYGGLFGDDRIYGLGGNDRLLGGGDDDLLIGGPNIDLVIGGSGFDICAAENRTGCERVRVGA